MRRVGQHPLGVRKEIRGFVLNRILAAMMNEFFHLIAEGVLDPAEADAALTEGFGLRWACMGPFAAMDLNAKGGIGDYLRRYGYIFDAVAEERGARPGRSEAVIDALTRTMRARHPLETAATRAAARDGAIARLRGARTLLD